MKTTTGRVAAIAKVKADVAKLKSEFTLDASAEKLSVLIKRSAVLRRNLADIRNMLDGSDVRLYDEQYAIWRDLNKTFRAMWRLREVKEA